MLHHKNWAVVGDVFNKSKPANAIVRHLYSLGYTVFCVDPRSPVTATAAHSAQVASDKLSGSRRKQVAEVDLIDPTTFPNYGCLGNIKQLTNVAVDVVDLAINPTLGLKMVQDMKLLGINNVFIQPGAESSEIVDYCLRNGLNFHKGCVLVEARAPPKL